MTPDKLAAEARGSIDVLYGALVDGEYAAMDNGASGLPDDFEPSFDDEMEALERFSKFVADLPPGPRDYISKLICNVHDLPWPEANPA